MTALFDSDMILLFLRKLFFILAKGALGLWRSLESLRSGVQSRTSNRKFAPRVRRTTSREKVLPLNAQCGAWLLKKMHSDYEAGVSPEIGETAEWSSSPWTCMSRTIETFFCARESHSPILAYCDHEKREYAYEPAGDLRDPLSALLPTVNGRSEQEWAVSISLAFRVSQVQRCASQPHAPLTHI